jgi:hypothetical protein
MAKPDSHFAEAAERMDRFIQEVKSRQFAATGAKLPPAPPPRPMLHPDEDWQTRYASRSIQPLKRGEAPAPMPQFAAPPLSERPRFPDALPPGKVSDPVPRTHNGGHIGAALGKPGKKRGLLGRLLRGRDN